MIFISDKPQPLQIRRLLIHTTVLKVSLYHLQIERLNVCYWPVDEPQLYSADKFPGFIFSTPLGNNDMHIYGFPINEYPGLIKVTRNALLGD